MNRKQLFVGAGSLVLLALAYTGVGSAGGNEPQSVVLFKPDDSETVALGKQIYADNCAACHGVQLQGQTENWQYPGPDGLMPAPPHDETGHTWHHPDMVLFKITKLGMAKAANLKDYVSAMPAYEDILSDEEIIAVLSYIKSTWPAEIRAGHDRMNENYALEPPETR